MVKKSHRLKNNLLCDDQQYIHYLSPTENGSLHDKLLADEYPLSLPAGSVVRQDLGFIGHKLENVLIEIPYKTPPKGELSFSQQLFNQMLASTRVIVEHANSGVKRLRMVKDTLRIQAHEFRDKVMVVACGLHNLRVSSPSRAYLTPRVLT